MKASNQIKKCTLVLQKGFPKVNLDDNKVYFQNSISANPQCWKTKNIYITFWVRKYNIFALVTC